MSEAVSIIDFLAFELLRDRVDVLETQVSLLVSLLDDFVLKEGVEGGKVPTHGCGGSC
jgi:hypothetical protein